MTETPEWAIRPAIEEDIAFIYSTWLSSMADHFVSKKMGVRKTDFYNNYPETIDTILADDSTRIAVASKVDDPIVMFGYIVFSPTCIYSIFVKSPLRKYGIGLSLYNHAKGKEHGKAA